MKEYMVSYISLEDGRQMVGSGYGNDELEAIKSFMETHSTDCAKILEVQFYKECNRIFVA